MDNEREKRLNRIIEVMQKYSDKLSALSVEMEKVAIEEDIDHIGKVSNIIKVLIGTMENPYDLDDFNAYCRIFSAKLILDRMDDNANKSIRASLTEFYDKAENEENEENE